VAPKPRYGVWITTNKNGKRVAYYWSTQAQRAIPLPVLDAERMIATGEAVDIRRHPITGKR
jgi:hypothetical protein